MSARSNHTGDTLAMTVGEAQSDMRRAYASGALGVLASALAWSAAATTAALVSPALAIPALLIGGALIHPVGLLLCRLAGASARHATSNPLGQLAGASTFWLMFSLPLAYGLGLQQPMWFFAAMLLIIGGRCRGWVGVALGLSLDGRHRRRRYRTGVCSSRAASASSMGACGPFARVDSGSAARLRTPPGR